MMTWIGALARGGVVPDPEGAAGEAVAAFVVGEDRLAELRSWLSEAEAAPRERRAAVEVCIVMAHADREIHAEERHLLRLLVGSSGLDADTQDELVTLIHEPPTLDGMAERIWHPVLRELILALVWELALADGRVDAAEEQLFSRLTAIFEVSSGRADEIREAVSARV